MNARLVVRVDKKGARKRAKGRSPLGGYIARFLDPRTDNRVLARELFGEERADRWLQGLSRVRLRHRGKFRADYHSDDAAHSGRFLAWLCMLLEQLNQESLRACSRKLYQGRTRRWDAEKKRVVYVRAPKGKGAGGVAARLGVSPREVQRYARLAADLGILQRWQVKKQVEVMQLPRAMRGKRFGYSILRWLGGVPYEVKARIASWWGRGQEKRPSAPEQAASAPPVQTGDPTLDRLLREALDDLAHKLDPA